MSYKLLITIIILLLINLIMGEFIKWFSRQPTWVKLAFLGFVFSFIFWYPLADYFFKPDSWYKSLMYALFPSLVWYLLALIQHYYVVSILQAGDMANIHKSNLFWISIGADVFIYFLVFASVLMIVNVSWKTFMLVIFGYKILAILITKPFYIALEKKDEI